MPSQKLHSLKIKERKYACTLLNSETASSTKSSNSMEVSHSKLFDEC